MVHDAIIQYAAAKNCRKNRDDQNLDVAKASFRKYYKNYSIEFSQYILSSS